MNRGSYPQGDRDVIVTTAGFRMSLRDPGTEGSLGDRAAFSQVFLARESDFLLSRIGPGDTVLDAGANIGCFTLQASRRVGPQGFVIAVEPEPLNANCLRTNVRLNAATNVIIIEKALDSVSDRTVHLLGTGTMASVEETARASDARNPGAGSLRSSVQTITLDGILIGLPVKRLDFIKMDIEGAEKSIFSTASTSSALRGARAVAVEIHDSEGPPVVQGRLRAEGYANVGEVKPESGFLITSIRAALRRPDLVLRLYGIEAVTILARMLSATRTTQSVAGAAVVGIVYAAR